MEISARASLTDAEKRVWLFKVIYTFITALVFIVGYNMSENYEIGILIVVLITIVVAFALKNTLVTVYSFVGELLIATVFVLAATLVFEITFTITSAFIITLMITFIFIDTNNPKYKIGIGNNLMSGVLQFLMTWYLLHILQYLHISITWS